LDSNCFRMSSTDSSGDTVEIFAFTTQFASYLKFLLSVLLLINIRKLNKTKCVRLDSTFGFVLCFCLESKVKAQLLKF